MIRTLFALCLLASPALADSLRYSNSRFGTVADLPLSAHIVAVAENGDGATFNLQNREGTVRIYGSTNPWGGGLEGYRKALMDIQAERQNEMVYEAGGEGWFVISGVAGNEYFYNRVEGCKNGPMHHIDFTYNVTDRDAWEKIIEQYAGSLEGPCK